MLCFEPMKRPAAYVAVALAVVLLAGSVTLLAGSGNSGSSQADARTTPPRKPFVRDCDSRGEPSGTPPKDSVPAGPLVFLRQSAFAVQGPSQFASRAQQVGFHRYLRGPRGRRLSTAERSRLQRLAPHHYDAVKFPVLLRAGARVTLTVPESQRRHVSFLFDPRPTGRQIGPYHSYAVSDGTPAVRFIACPANEEMFSGTGSVGPYTAFPGAIIVAGPRCVTFDVWVDGQDEAIRRTLSFGAGSRCEGG